MRGDLVLISEPSMCNLRKERRVSTLWPLLLYWVVGCSGAPESRVEERVANTTEHRLELVPRGVVQAGRGGDGSARWFSDHVFVLHNQGDHVFPYVLQGSVDWLRVTGPADGVLAPAKRLTIEVSIDPKLAPTKVGQYDAQLWVLNGVTFYREFSIDVAWVVPVGGDRTLHDSLPPAIGSGSVPLR